jgi:hypothetical protein
MNIETHYDLATAVEVTRLPPLAVRRVSFIRHEHGFQVTLHDHRGAGPGNSVELFLDPEGMKILIGGLVHPNVVSQVKALAPDNLALMTALEKVAR